jgi:hypothetical protein
MGRIPGRIGVLAGNTKVRITDMRQPRSALRRSISLLTAVAMVAALVTAGVGPAIALTVIPAAAAPAAPAIAAPPLVLPVSTQFDITGFLQEAALGGPGTGPGTGAHQGGSLKVNGMTVIVPSETIVILPANALTWQELFAQAPAPYTGVATGMALADLPAPMSTYEVHVVGNRVGDTYIAGLVNISQQGLNSGAGFINFMDYALGEMRVGGIANDPLCVANAANTVAGGPTCSGARVRINDPQNASLPAGSGRYGRANTPDQRFTVDQDNPTISAGTGFPMCFPRVIADPSVAGNPDDPQCPQANRPLDVGGVFSMKWTTNDPTIAGLPAFPSAKVQAPFEVGDYITFAGTLVHDGATPTTGPWAGTAGTYVSAHTIVSNVAIYTAPGTNPAYVITDVTLIGTGGLTIIGAGEAAIRTRFEGMTTDPSRQIHLYGIDINPTTGATTDRDWGFIGVDQGPPTGAVKGRWRFRPPCLAFGTVPTKPDKQCVIGPDGTFLPPTREMRAVIEGLQVQNPANTACVLPQTNMPAVPLGQNCAETAANGIFYGQYHAPITDYIFPENLPGTPVVPNNFEAMPFLGCGGYTSAAATRAAQLNPWPGQTAPTCLAAPVANAGGPYGPVGSGGTVALSGSATGSAPLTFLWTASAGTFSSATSATPIFTAPSVAADTTVTLSLTATNTVGTSAPSTVTILVSKALAPIIDPIANQSVVSGNSGNFAVTGSDPNVPAATPLTYSVAQSPLGTLTGLTVTQTPPTGATVSYTAPTGVTVDTPVTLTITATNTAGVSTSATITLTITPAVVACVAPVVTAGGPYSVGFGGTISLAGSSTGTAPITYLWTATAGSFTSGAATLTPVYSAAGVAAGTVVTLTLTANNCSLTPGTATATVTVGAALPPVVNHVTPISVFSSATGSLTVSASDPNSPALLPLTFSVTQSPAGTLTFGAPTLVTPTSEVVNFTAPVLPVGQVTPVVVNITITATNAAVPGLVSAPEFTSVTVVPLPDSVSITSTEYRTGKQRLLITATSSVVSPNVILTLKPYLTESGNTFDPGNVTFTNGGNGLYTMTLVGAPPPACNGGVLGGPVLPYATPCSKAPLRAASNLGGISAFHALDRIRQ